jgi:hypothetical protein
LTQAAVEWCELIPTLGFQHFEQPQSAKLEQISDEAEQAEPHLVWRTGSGQRTNTAIAQ